VQEKEATGTHFKVKFSTGVEQSLKNLRHGMVNHSFLGVAAELVVIRGTKAVLLATTEGRLRALVSLFLRSTLNMGIVWNRDDLDQYLAVVKRPVSAT
jgi:hypothetical protein